MPRAVDRSLTRRSFLQITGATVSAVAASRAIGAEPMPVTSAAKTAANDKVNVAFIGVTNKGAENLANVTKAGGNVVALCDVDTRHLDEASKKYPNARRHTDWRKLLEDQKDIDAVVVTIPDHSHAVAAMHAMALGKHVYCEKPLTHDIYEARMLTEAARKYKVATQMGNSGTASEGLRAQVDWIRAGAIGPVREVWVWTNRPIWPQGIDRPSDTPPVPPELDWDLWLGPAPARPYNPAYHPFKWRGFWDFGTGALGDMACHLMNSAYWALELKGPCEVEAESEGQTAETAPKWSIITYSFPARGELPPVRVKWFDGGKVPPKPEEVSQDVWRKSNDGGVMFIGEKGKMLGGSGTPPVLLGDLGKDFVAPPRKVPKSPGHYQEWLGACRGRTPAMANFDYAGPLTETVLLGNVALRLGKRIEWDSAEMKVRNTPGADALIRREYRTGWSL